MHGKARGVFLTHGASRGVSWIDEGLQQRLGATALEQRHVLSLGQAGIGKLDVGIALCELFVVATDLFVATLDLFVAALHRLVEFLECSDREKHLTADLNELGMVGALKLTRDVGDRERIARHIFAARTVAARSGSL